MVGACIMNRAYLVGVFVGSEGWGSLGGGGG